jgi:glycosyltransferase involved in cell wall biosynthesis
MSDDAEQVVLSNYPLSRDFRDRLAQYFGSTPRFLDVVELRRISSLGRVFRDLRAIRAKLLSIAIEDESGNSTLPMLAVVAAVTRAKRLQWVGPQLKITRMSRLHAAAYGLRILAESFMGAVEFHRSHSELRALERAARIEPKAVAIPNVAYLNCNLWFGLKAGGSVGHISGVANSLMDHGLSLRLFAVGGRLLVDERAVLVPLVARSIPALPIERTHYRFNRRCVSSIGREFSKHDVGFIYQRLSLGNYTGVALSRRFGVPLVLEYNGSEAWVAKNWGRPLRYHVTAVLAEDVALRHAHVIVTVSDVLRSELIERGVDSDRIVTYPNCVDPKIYDPARFPAEENARLREQLGLDPTDIVATFVGTFGQWHGVDVLAQAIRKMVLERRDLLDALRLRFLLVGDGLKMSVVRAALNGIGAEPYVHLTGLVPQREAPRFLAASDILLSPHVTNADGSRFFGSPTKLFEYMAMGRGIVASDLDQLGDILQPAIKLHRGDQGGSDAAQSRAVAVLAEPGNVEQLIRGIELLAQDEALRHTLGRNAYQLARERYTWRHHVAAILSAMNRLGLRAPVAAPPEAGV